MLRWRWLAVFVLLLSCLLVPALAEWRALLIGCDQFLSQESTAPSSANNVHLMTEALRGTVPADRLIAQPDGLSDKERLRALAEEAFAGTGPDDVCCFYISTHGLWEEGMAPGEFAMLLSDGLQETRLTAAELKAILDPYGGRKFLILDACHSGAVLGKGISALSESLFTGREYTLICSSGGAEESWFWAGESDLDRGSGYFTGCLVRGISAAGNYGADENRDGTVLLQELQRYLLANHGASTVRVYPEDSSFPVAVYSRDAAARLNRNALVDGLTFEVGALSIASPTIAFSFTVLQPLRLAYQLVYQRDGAWDFANAELRYDEGDRSSLPGRQPGSLQPGYKERRITLQTYDEDYGEGYVLLQLLAIQGSAVDVVGATVLCIPPADADPALTVSATEAFCPDYGEECALIVTHAVPCELSVAVLDADGRTVRRLASRDPSRPEQLVPTASSLTWSGRLNDGTYAPAGTYTLRVSAVVGDTLWRAPDVSVTLKAPEEPAQPLLFLYLRPLPAFIRPELLR